MITSISGLIKKDIVHVYKHHWKQFLSIGVVIWLLLFLLNIFVGVSSYTHSFTDTLRDKLGIYFYIKDTAGQESLTYKKVIDLQSNLQKQGLKVMFSSKDDAMKFLEQKIPEVADNFDKFGIDNTLPSTLYVMFKNQSQYNIIKDVVLEYKDIILNNKDFEGSSIKEQENRTLWIINLTNFITTTSLVIIICIVLTIFILLVFLTRFFFHYFQKHVEIKNLLGGSSYEITKEFTLVNFITLAFGFGLALILMLVTWSSLGVYINQIFSIQLIDIVSQSSNRIVLIAFAAEIILFALFSFIYSYFYSVSVSKKIY